MGEPAEDNVRNEYDDLKQRVVSKRALYPEDCARLLYKTCKAEEYSFKHALIDLPDKDKHNRTNVLKEIQTVSLILNKEVKELSGHQLNLEDFQKRCDSVLKKCKEVQTALLQIKNELNDGTTKYC